MGEQLDENSQTKLNEILGLNRFDLKMLYWELPTPAIEIVSGEYDAQLLDQGDPIGSFITRRIFGSRGQWLGKAFRPLSSSNGEGYNAFGTPRDREALLPMDTYIGDSFIVPGNAYMLNYRAKNSGPIRWLLGELRQATPEILLGMGTFGPRGQRLAKLRRVIPFVLVLSDRPYLNCGERTDVETVPDFATIRKAA